MGFGRVNVGGVNVDPSDVRVGVKVGHVTGTFTSDATATDGHLILGTTAYSNGVLRTGTIPDLGGQLLSAASVRSNGTSIYMVPPYGCYHSNAEVAASDPDFVASNIPSNKNFFGVQGTMLSYANWTYFTITGHTHTGNPWTSYVTYSGATLTAGCPIHAPGISYGIVTYVNGAGGAYIWWRLGARPSGIFTAQYSPAGSFPEGYDDAGSVWTYTQTLCSADTFQENRTGDWAAFQGATPYFVSCPGMMRYTFITGMVDYSEGGVIQLGLAEADNVQNPFGIGGGNHIHSAGDEYLTVVWKRTGILRTDGRVYPMQVQMTPVWR